MVWRDEGKRTEREKGKRLAAAFDKK